VIGSFERGLKYDCAIREPGRCELSVEGFGKCSKVLAAARQPANRFEVNGVHSKLLERSRDGSWKAGPLRHRREIRKRALGGEQVNDARSQSLK
jgi:hypothetical protein